jgi:glutathione synthase/RimK-type ligase-like ATP-grasp enzyme
MTARIWLLDRVESSWEMAALSAELTGRGHHTELVDWSSLAASATPPGFALGGRLAVLPQVALVRPRVLARHTEGDLALLYDWLGHLEDCGVRLVNTAQALRRTKNKVVQAAVLTRAGVPVPDTRVARGVRDVEDCLREWDHIVVKPIGGHSGLDVVPIRARAGLLGGLEERTVWHLIQRYGALCAQRYLEHPDRELRVVWLDGRIVSCYHHPPSMAPGSDRTGWHAATKDQRSAVEPTAELCRLVGTATDALALDLATIDLVETATGLAILEINPTLASWHYLEGRELDRTERGITSQHADLLVGLL